MVNSFADGRDESLYRVFQYQSNMDALSNQPPQFDADERVVLILEEENE